jgi:epoxide hydrolase 4
VPEKSTLATERGTFPILKDGPEDGPVVFLLHGFPQLNVSWHRQITALAESGYRVIAPNQRGYPGAPTGPYGIGELAADVVAMIDSLGVERAAIVGHDWGGAVAWMVAELHPTRVSGLAVLNCPHPRALAAQLKSNPKQLLRSWYVLFFQVPELPERLISSRMPGLLVAGSFNRKAWNRAALTPYAEAFSQPEALKGPIGWYRAARSPQPRGLPIACPVLVIWGVHDRFLDLRGRALRPR